MTDVTPTKDAWKPVKAHRSLAKDVWIQFRSHKGALIGTFVFVHRAGRDLIGSRSSTPPTRLHRLVGPRTRSTSRSPVCSSGGAA